MPMKNSLTGTAVTVEEARAARAEQISSAPSQTSAQTSLDPSTQDEPRILTFAQLKALIEQGRTDEIPNNKVIPNVLSVRLYVCFCWFWV